MHCLGNWYDIEYCNLDIDIYKQYYCGSVNQSSGGLESKVVTFFRDCFCLFFILSQGLQFIGWAGL